MKCIISNTKPNYDSKLAYDQYVCGNCDIFNNYPRVTYVMHRYISRYDRNKVHFKQHKTQL